MYYLILNIQVLFNIKYPKINNFINVKPDFNRIINVYFDQNQYENASKKCKIYVTK